MTKLVSQNCNFSPFVFPITDLDHDALPTEFDHVCWIAVKSCIFQAAEFDTIADFDRMLSILQQELINTDALNKVPRPWGGSVLDIVNLC